MRSYVRGEGLWAKAQKDAVLYLNNYSYSGLEADYEAYKEALKVIDGDNKARLALQKSPPDIGKPDKDFYKGSTIPTTSIR